MIARILSRALDKVASDTRTCGCIFCFIRGHLHESVRAGIQHDEAASIAHFGLSGRLPTSWVGGAVCLHVQHFAALAADSFAVHAAMQRIAALARCRQRRSSGSFCLIECTAGGSRLGSTAESIARETVCSTGNCRGTSLMAHASLYSFTCILLHRMSLLLDMRLLHAQACWLSIACLQAGTHTCRGDVLSWMKPSKTSCRKAAAMAKHDMSLGCHHVTDHLQGSHNCTHHDTATTCNSGVGRCQCWSLSGQ